MFNHLLHNHTMPTVNSEGQIVGQRATCADAQAFYGTHTGTDLAADGNGGTKMVLTVVGCVEAEAERQELLRQVKAQENAIEAQGVEIMNLQADVANYRRLIAGAMQIVFRMGPALQNLLAEDLEKPTLTDDGTAVKVDNVQFTVLIDPFRERITVRPTMSNVEECSFSVVNGRLSAQDQTTLLGYVDRVRKSVTGPDPVQQCISLVDDTQAAA